MVRRPISFSLYINEESVRRRVRLWTNDPIHRLEEAIRHEIRDLKPPVWTPGTPFVIAWEENEYSGYRWYV
jgi:hypothetical protein